MRKAVLLDFDGVVLRNKVADSCVSRRAAIYTWKAVNNVPRSMSEISIKQAGDLCYSVYKGYGHTVLGLQAIGVDASLKDFNRMVYSTIDYDKVRAHNNSMDGVRKLIEHCRHEGTDIFMFSNAPYTWIENVLKNDADIIESIPDVRDVLGVSADDSAYLKPQRTVYDAASSKLMQQQRYDKIILVDDNAANLWQPWTNLLYGTCSKKISNTLRLVSSFDDVIDVV